MTTAAPRPLGANFVRFWIGQGLAQLGTRLAAVAMPVLAVQVLNANADQLGYLNAAATAAFLLVGLPAGAWIDRWQKRVTMIWADVVRLIAAFAVPLLYLLDLLQLWQLYLVAAVVGVATVFFDVAYQSLIPVMVDDDQIGPANARLESTAQLASLAGPAVGGLALKIISAPMLMLADAIGYLMSTIFLLMTRDHEADHRGAKAPRDAAHRGPTLRQEIAEGLRFVLGHRVLRRIVACTGLSNLTSTMAFTLYPLLTLRILGISPFALGVTMAAASLGGVAGAATSAAISRRLGEARTIVGSAALFSIAGALVPVATVMPGRTVATAWLIGTQLLSSFAVVVYNVTQVSLRQRLCPKPLLGRMNASIRFMIWGVMPIGSLASGWLAHRLGVMPTIWGASALTLVCVLPILALPRLLGHQPATP